MDHCQPPPRDRPLWRSFRKPKDFRKETFLAVLDLGGRSTQVFGRAFDKEQPNSMLKDGGHKHDLMFGGGKHVLYQHSYLGYGLKQAREHVHRLVEFLAPERKYPTQKRVIPNSCLTNGTKDDVTIGEGGEQRTISMNGVDVGSSNGCS